jgi:hypothetical protein
VKKGGMDADPAGFATPVAPQQVPLPFLSLLPDSFKVFRMPNKNCVKQDTFLNLKKRELDITRYPLISYIRKFEG